MFIPAIFLILCLISFNSVAFGQEDRNLRGAIPGIATAASVDLADKSRIKDAPTNAEVLKALDDWGKGLVSIATAKTNNEDYKTVAKNVIKKSYNYDNSIVLFKPTLAADIPFRTTFDGALSYFVGDNADFPEDYGFALSPWENVSFEVVGIVYDTNRALVQTKTTFTKTDDSIVLAYFSIAFTRESKRSSLKIDLHHSSLPPTH